MKEKVILSTKIWPETPTFGLQFSVLHTGFPMIIDIIMHYDDDDHASVGRRRAGPGDLEWVDQSQPDSVRPNPVR